LAKVPYRAGHKKDLSKMDVKITFYKQQVTVSGNPHTASSTARINNRLQPNLSLYLAGN
jgi:hypothetical protein